jgi:hypothetical protein
VQLNIERGAPLQEFREFLADLEQAYVSLYLLPSRRELRRLERWLPLPIEYLGLDFIGVRQREPGYPDQSRIYPEDQLEITRITIRSAGWVELLGSLNPLQQIREYLKDRHERKKDKAWRWETEKQRAQAEVKILHLQAERERIGAIKDFNDLLEHIDISPEQRRKILWERVGVPLARLGHHQDTGLLGSQNDNIDGKRE